MFLRIFTALALIAALGYALGYSSGYQAAVADRAIRDLGRAILASIADLTAEDDDDEAES